MEYIRTYIMLYFFQKFFLFNLYHKKMLIFQISLYTRKMLHNFVRKFRQKLCTYTFFKLFLQSILFCGNITFKLLQNKEIFINLFCYLTSNQKETLCEKMFVKFGTVHVYFDQSTSIVHTRNY